MRKKAFNVTYPPPSDNPTGPLQPIPFPPPLQAPPGYQFPPNIQQGPQFAPFPPPTGYHFAGPPAPMGSSAVSVIKKLGNTLNLKTVVYVAGAIAVVSTAFALLFGDARLTSVAVVAGIITAAAWGKDTADKQSAREQATQRYAVPQATVQYAPVPQPQTAHFPAHPHAQFQGHPAVNLSDFSGQVPPHVAQSLTPEVPASANVIPNAVADETNPANDTEL